MLSWKSAATKLNNVLELIRMNSRKSVISIYCIFFLQEKSQYMLVIAIIIFVCHSFPNAVGTYYAQVTMIGTLSA